jgi:hypothetical protein
MTPDRNPWTPWTREERRALKCAVLGLSALVLAVRGAWERWA